MPKSEWIDVTLPLNQTIPQLDPKYSPPDSPVNPPNGYRIFDVDNGDPVTMSRIEINSHDGTHIDAPLHFIVGGQTIDTMPVETTVGPVRVIEIKDEKQVTVRELEPFNIKEGERIFLKTRNSGRVYTKTYWDEDFVIITPEAAGYLAGRKVRLIGFDYMTIAGTDPRDSVSRVHKAFLSNGVFILEGLDLNGVAPGDYDLICLPLRLEKGDAGPCRVCIRPIK